MKKKIIISAYNVHQGGGKILLLSLLESLNVMSDVEATVLLDKRFVDQNQNDWNFKVISIQPNTTQRLKAESVIKILSEHHDVLLCFGNLPPLYSIKIKTFVFIQNKYLLSKNFICWTNTKTVVRMTLEKLWFELRKSSHYIYLVQTASMKRAFTSSQGDILDCQVLGFFNFSAKPIGKNLDNNDIKISSSEKFLYIASGEPHKNHHNLILAWQELATNSLYPNLTLVLDESRFTELSQWTRSIKDKYNLNINIISIISRTEILNLYQTHDALIFPSTFESFGLPLLEAVEANLPIVASELDYVRDVCTPKETFNPQSPTSISRAVKRFMGISEKNILVDSNQFLKLIVWL